MKCKVFLVLLRLRNIQSVCVGSFVYSAMKVKQYWNSELNGNIFQMRDFIIWDKFY